MTRPTTHERAAVRVAVLTAGGRGAIAVVRVWGDDALRIAGDVFRPLRGKRLDELPAGRLRVGRVGAGMGDEVVAFVVEADPPEVEIQCHGGPAAIALVLAAFQDVGAEAVAAGDWLARHGSPRVTWEAAIDLPRASTVAAAEILRDQADGALEREIRSILVDLEHDTTAALRSLDGVIDRARVGVHLVDGWRVVLAGRPNVGKSRLLNALAGYGRAIVDATPGTTRDVVTVRTAIAGWPVELADTAGLRDTGDPIESAGVARARAEQGAADLIILVLDGSEPLTSADRELAAIHPSAIRVASKADLPAAWEPATLGALPTSAAQGKGLVELVEAIGGHLASHPIPPGAGVPFRPAHEQVLRRARALLAGGRVAAVRSALDRLLEPAFGTGSIA